tara:strand:+ start:528 stop:833 length:306 start_codon:yes stop_codon:yes gene_type:complete
MKQESTYKAQCITFGIAQRITGNLSRVTKGNVAFEKPFCLRLAPEYRTQDVQAFRNTVARATRKARRGKHYALSIVKGKLYVLCIDKETGATVLRPHALDN